MQLNDQQAPADAAQAISRSSTGGVRGLHVGEGGETLTGARRFVVGHGRHGNLDDL